MQERLARRQKMVRLGNKITELAAHLDAGEYRFLILVEAFDQEEGWSGTGIASCAHWLNYRCGISIGVAREKVRVARALPDLPQISKAFSEGRVSYSKVRAMTRVATPQNEDALLNVALHGTACHVERQVRLYRQVKRREALAAENLRQAQRELTWYVDEAGCWVFRGRFTAEQGAVISQALEAALEFQFQEGRDEPAEVAEEIEHGEVCQPGVAEPIAQRRADALERMATAYLAAPKAGGSSGDRYTVNLHTDIETLKVDGIGAEAEVEAGGRHAHVPAGTSYRFGEPIGKTGWKLRPELLSPAGLARKWTAVWRYWPWFSGSEDSPGPIPSSGWRTTTLPCVTCFPLMIPN